MVYKAVYSLTLTPTSLCYLLLCLTLALFSLTGNRVHFQERLDLSHLHGFELLLLFRKFYFSMFQALLFYMYSSRAWRIANI